MPLPKHNSLPKKLSIIDIDAIIKKVQDVKTDTLDDYLDNMLSQFVVTDQLDNGLRLSEQLMELFSPQKFPKNYAAIQFFRAIVYNISLQYKKGYFCISEVINIYIHYKDIDTYKYRLGRAYSLESVVLNRLSNYNDALEAAERTLVIGHQINDKKLIVKAYINLSLIYEDIGQIEKALQYILKAINISDVTVTNITKCALAINAGVCFFKLEKVDKAKAYFAKGLAYLEKQRSPFSSLRTYATIALHYFQNRHILNSEDIKNAIDYSKQSFALISETNRYNDDTILVYTAYFSSLIEQKKYTLLIELYPKIDEYLDKSLSPHRYRILELLVIAHKKLGQFEEAFYIHEKIVSFFKENESPINKGHNLSLQQNIDRISKARVEIELQKENNVKLQAEINRRKVAEQKLINSNKELASFASVASHDMREPLRIITSYSQLLHRKVKDDTLLLELSDFIVDASKRMEKILADLIEFVRINVNIPDKTTVNLSYTLEVEILNFRTSIKETGIQITKPNDLPIVHTFSGFFNIIFRNLLSNAIKYHTKTQVPKLAITYQFQNDLHTICFIDNGIGMNEEFTEIIFEPFRRLHSKKDYPGVGLGLAAVARIVKEHLNGNVSVVSEIGKGSTFTITFPEPL